MKQVIALMILILLGCKEQVINGDTSVLRNDTIQNPEPKKELTMQEERRQMLEEEKVDSLRLEFALKDAFKTALPYFHSNNYVKQYDLLTFDSLYEIRVEILIGRLFENNQTYFLLRRTNPRGTYLNLYRITGDKPKKLIERKQAGMSYIRDTIFDANGDGHSDFIVHWYPESGCCRRNVYNVYLNQPKNETFTKDYQFINPTFSAKEKIIRGIEYGHPGEVGLYKYKWNGFRVDTIEFIYPDVNNKGQFIKTKGRVYRPTEKEGIILKVIPKEYQRIESYEWFANY